MIIGFSFNKINMEKRNPVTGKVDINNNAFVKDVEESDFSLGKHKQKGLTFTFQFTSKYEPDIGDLLFEGEILYLADPKVHEEIVKNLKKDKKEHNSKESIQSIPNAVMAEVIDAVLTRSNIEALILSRDLNLPPPVPLPKVKREE